MSEGDAVRTQHGPHARYVLTLPGGNIVVTWVKRMPNGRYRARTYAYGSCLCTRIAETTTFMADEVCRRVLAPWLGAK
jgi:ribosomal protein L34E